MSKQKIEIELDVPAGFRLIGYRKANKGDWYCDGGRAHQVTTVLGTTYPWPILEKLEPEIRTGFINVYPVDRNYSDWVHPDRKSANSHAASNRIACVEVKYEVPAQ